VSSSTSQPGLKLELAGEGDAVLSNREEPGNGAVLETNRETPVKCLKDLEHVSLKW